MIYIDTKKQGELGTSASDFMQLDDEELNEAHGVKKRPKAEAATS